jgi:hypothetical protein
MINDDNVLDKDAATPETEPFHRLYREHFGDEAYQAALAIQLEKQAAKKNKGSKKKK